MESLDNTPSKKRFESIKTEVPFMPGWEVAITGSDVPSDGGEYETINGIHIWKIDEDDWNTLTEVGFVRMMDFVESLIKQHHIESFVIDAGDEKRKRVFKKWAIRKGCDITQKTDFFGDEVDVFRLPKNE